MSNTFRRSFKKALASETPDAYRPANVSQAKIPDLCADIQTLGFKDYHTLLGFLNAAVTGTTNDKDLLLENLIQLLAKLPSSSKEGKDLTDGLLQQLWTSLDHPPQSSLDEKFRFRSADGSGNNINLPHLGAAGTAYARTVRPMTYQSPEEPDPSLIFDSLMARGDTFTPHPQGISSMLFYLATIIIHDLFQTSPEDYNVNLTSSYLDLSPLYGCNEEEQLAMRTMKNGTIKPDCFSSKRILGFPPGCGVLLVMFNRFHNYVVTQLARINENNRFPPPRPSLTDPELAAYLAVNDNLLFQTGRLITCGFYANVILNDYVRTILALNRTSTTWNLDPRSTAAKNAFSKPLPQGVGNQVSVEFNLIYRWHSAISEKDEKWTHEQMERLLGDDVDPEEANVRQVLAAMREWEEKLSAEPTEREFGELKRQKDGTYEDDALVKIFKESIEDIAGAFGANKVPRVMKTIEVLGIMQARFWNVATLNEFRDFMGLTRHETFEDINPDPMVARRLRDLYDSPDAVELYPGLVAEKPKPPMDPGSGLCVNYTTSRAILSDAVALVRGDRFHTLDYTPKSVTNWGYCEAGSDLAVDNGHVFHKLVFRAFPNSGIDPHSIYAHFPFVIPSENHKIHSRLGTLRRYHWAAPPTKSPYPTIMIRSHAAVKHILGSPSAFAVPWGEPITHATCSPFSSTFCLAGDLPANRANRAQLHKAMYSPQDWPEEIKDFLRHKTPELLRKFSKPIPIADNPTADPEKQAITTYEVDLVRDIVAMVATHFMSAMFSVPLKTESNPDGVWTDKELYEVFTNLFSSVFYDTDIVKSFEMREQATEQTATLGKLIMGSAGGGSKEPGGLLNGWVERLKIGGGGGGGGQKGKGKEGGCPHPEGNGSANGPAHHGEVKGQGALKSFGTAMIARVASQLDGGVEEAVLGSVVTIVASGTSIQMHVLAQALDYYLGPAGSEHLVELRRLATLDTKEADEKLTRYMLEGSRLRGTVALMRDVMSDQTVKDHAPCMWDSRGSHDPIPVDVPQRRTHQMKAGTRILLDLTAASHDPCEFKDPEKVRLDRDIDNYIHYGFGPHRCLGMQMSRVVLTEMFKGVVRLQGLERADGPRGEMKNFPASRWNGQIGRATDSAWSGLRVYMTPDQKSYWIMPTTMKVRYDVANVRSDFR